MSCFTVKFQKTYTVLLWVLVGCLIWFLVHTIFVIWVGLYSEVKKADVAIVLGNAVDRNGIPSPRLQSRLNRAIKLYQDKTVKKIIVSGGKGATGYEEAEVMKDVLVESGIPAINIIVDKHGFDTFQTAHNSKLIMEAEGFKTALIVTQYYHIARTKLAFERFEVSPVHSAYAEMGPEIRDPYALFREFVAFYYYLLRRYPEIHAPSQSS